MADITHNARGIVPAVRITSVRYCLLLLLPTDQFRQSGGSAAGVALAKSYKGNPLPGATTNLQNAGTTVSRRYITGLSPEAATRLQGGRGVT